MKNICPLCNNMLTATEEQIDGTKVPFIEYFCKALPLQHFYIHRISDDVIINYRVRLTNDDYSNLYIRVILADNFTEIWANDSWRRRIKIDNVIAIEGLTFEKLQSKIKIFLTFA